MRHLDIEYKDKSNIKVNMLGVDDMAAGDVFVYYESDIRIYSEYRIHLNSEYFIDSDGEVLKYAEQEIDENKFYVVGTAKITFTVDFN